MIHDDSGPLLPVSCGGTIKLEVHDGACVAMCDIHVTTGAVFRGSFSGFFKDDRGGSTK